MEIRLLQESDHEVVLALAERLTVVVLAPKSGRAIDFYEHLGYQQEEVVLSRAL